MKKIFMSAVLLMYLTNVTRAQNVNSILKDLSGNKKGNKNSSKNSSSSSNQGLLSTDDIAGGLKEALSSGVQKGTTQLSSVNGFFANAAIKILMPPEALKVETTLRNMGLGKQVDDAILSMNRAAEDATKSAAPIFLKAITSMTIGDAWDILKGSDTAATHYLRLKTTDSLTNAFSPVIKQSLDKADATKYWNVIFSTYNQVPFVSKVNPNLTAYVTGKGLDGIFYEISLEEKNIRQNPIARTTDLLRKVFGN